MLPISRSTILAALMVFVCPNAHALEFECSAETLSSCGFGKCKTESAVGTSFRYDSARAMVQICKEVCKDWGWNKFDLSVSDGSEKFARLRATTDTFTREYDLNIAPVMLADYYGFSATLLNSPMVETHSGTCRRDRVNFK